MHNFMVHTPDLWYLNPYSEQAKQLEPEYLADASGLNPGLPHQVRTLNR